MVQCEMKYNITIVFCVDIHDVCVFKKRYELLPNLNTGPKILQWLLGSPRVQNMNTRVLDGRKEVFHFNNALNTFYLRLYGKEPLR